MATTSIEWTDRVWNPVTGCTKVSAGCKHCYAETIADRFWKTQYPQVVEHFPDGSGRLERPRRFTDVRTHEDRLLEPLSWRKPSRVFVNSMSDLFHEDVPDEFIDKVFAVMAARSVHTFQILTKRADRMRAYMADQLRHETIIEAWSRTLPRRANRTTVEHWPLRNVWLGVSVEDQAHADERIPLLLQTPAEVRFISAEPLLGPVDLSFVPWPASRPRFPDTDDISDGFNPLRHNIHKLDWVIVGGESGPGARAMKLEWAESIVAQCKQACVAVFVKQLGSLWRGISFMATDGSIQIRDSKGGDPSEWPADLRVREFPEATR